MSDRSCPEAGVPIYESVGDGPILLYDGHCGACDRGVRLVLRFDRLGALRFAPLQGLFAREVLARHPWLREVDSLVWVRTPRQAGERVFVRSDALWMMIAYLGGPWRMLGVFRCLPRRVLDGTYELFARRRYRVFGRHSECRIPAPEHRSRFLG